MQILIRGDKLKITAAIKKHIEEKLGKLNKYFGNKDIKCNVVVKVKDNEQIIEVTIQTKKLTLRAEEKHSDLYAATDLVVDKLERQIRKNKTKITNKYKNIDVTDFVFDYEEVEEEKEKQIIKRKNIEIMPMDEEEAALQLELIDHDFYVFKNINEECISVLYRRKDGEYGIINAK